MPPCWGGFSLAKQKPTESVFKCLENIRHFEQQCWHHRRWGFFVFCFYSGSVLNQVFNMVWHILINKWESSHFWEVSEHVSASLLARRFFLQYISEGKQYCQLLRIIWLFCKGFSQISTSTNTARWLKQQATLSTNNCHVSSLQAGPEMAIILYCFPIRLMPHALREHGGHYHQKGLNKGHENIEVQGMRLWAAAGRGFLLEICQERMRNQEIMK